MPSKYTVQLLGPGVASSLSLAQVLRKLGLKPTGGNYRYLDARIRHAGISTAHFRSSSQHAWIDELTVDQLMPLVEQSRSVAQVCARLGLPQKAHRSIASGAS